MVPLKSSLVPLAAALAFAAVAAFAADPNPPAAKPAPQAAAPAAATVAAPATAPAATEPAIQVPAISTDTNPAAVLVTVDGVKLTRAEADARVAKRMDRVKDKIPPERMAKLEQSMGQQMVDEFVLQTLVANAAKKQSLTVSNEEVSRFIEEKIKSKLPPGMSLDQVMQKEKIDATELRKDIELQLTIKKLVEASMGDKAKPTQQEITDFYNKQKDSFKIPETVHARHILLATKKEDDEKARAAKKTQAEALRKQLVEGADFAKLAEANSDCPSKDRGGDLGSFSKGQMVKEFEKAAFSQKTNEIGAVVETQFGYHIIQVLEHGQPKTMSVEEAKESIVQYLTNQAQQEGFESMIEKLKGEAKIEYPKQP